MARVASLGQAKTLGGVGAILALLFWVPAHVGIVLLVAGLVLMLFAVKNIADIVGDQVIFSNMMYSVILAIIGPIIATVVLLAAAASFLWRFKRFHTRIDDHSFRILCRPWVCGLSGRDTLGLHSDLDGLRQEKLRYYSHEIES